MLRDRRRGKLESSRPAPRSRPNARVLSRGDRAQQTGPSFPPARPPEFSHAGFERSRLALRSRPNARALSRGVQAQQTGPSFPSARPSSLTRARVLSRALASAHALLCSLCPTFNALLARSQPLSGARQTRPFPLLQPFSPSALQPFSPSPFILFVSRSARVPVPWRCVFTVSRAAVSLSLSSSSLTPASLLSLSVSLLTGRLRPLALRSPLHRHLRLHLCLPSSSA